MAEKGKYIVIEGGEYVGKSTQSEILAVAIGGIAVREPGNTELGEHIRSILLDPGTTSTPHTEVLLHAAARAQLISEVVDPLIIEGKHVVSDRSWISSAAYQSAQGIEFSEIEKINNFAIGDYISPDLFILLDADPEIIKNRSRLPKDKYEHLNEDFHNKVRENYLELSEKLGAVVLDATQSKMQVSHKIRNVVKVRLKI